MRGLLGDRLHGGGHPQALAGGQQGLDKKRNILRAAGLFTEGTDVDEAFAQVLLALLEQAETGRGRQIDISMAQAAVSWLPTFLPMLDMGSPPSELRRAGNEHRQFIPVNAYPTRDGFIYVAVGSDIQWSRLVREPIFASRRSTRPSAWARCAGASSPPAAPTFAFLGRSPGPSPWSCC